MKENDIVQKFIDALINKYGYPRQAVKREVRIGNTVFDVAIQKGVVYVQVFEFKNELTHELHNVYQRFSDVCVETPFYCVIYDEKEEFKLFDGNNLEKEIPDVAGVLNYNNAVARFFRPTLKDFEAVRKKISCISIVSVIILTIYIVMYLICYICPGITIRLPLSYELITSVGFVIVLLLLSPLLKLWNYIKRIKVGTFELDLREEMYR